MGKGFYSSTNQKPANIARPAAQYLKPTSSADFTKPVSFDWQLSYQEKVNICTQLYNDNVIFLQSALALLTDQECPFLNERDLHNYNRFITSDRPEIQDRVKTLKFIRDNRDAWFKNRTVNFMRASVIDLFIFVRDNDILMDRGALHLGKDIDLNFAVQKAILEPNFDFDNPKNPVRKSWEGMAKQLREIQKQRDSLFSEYNL